jgi:hypothetical protein
MSSFLWRQITDPTLQLCLSVLIGVATVESLTAIWAAIARVHWFWRGLAVWAGVMLMIPIRAWELTWVFALSALLIVAAVQAGRWTAWRLGSRTAESGQLVRERYRYSLRDLFLLVLLVCLWMPGLVAAARNAAKPNGLSWLAAAACLAGLTVFAAKLAFGPRRRRALVLLFVGLPMYAAIMFATVSMTYVWMMTGGSGTYVQELTGLAIVGLEFVLIVAGVIGLVRFSRSPLRSRGQRAISAAALTVLAAVSGVWLGWVYVQLLQRPPTVARFELPGNRYARIVEIAERVNAINRKNASIADLRSAAPNSAAASELETFYEELLPLLAAENAVPYDPERDGKNAYPSSNVQVLRGLCRSLEAESATARIKGEPDLAADYALACLGLSEALGRGGTAVDALVSRALEGVGYAQLAKLRGDLSASKRREALAALARDPDRRDEPAVLRARELDYSERALGFSARLETMFLNLAGRKFPWEEALGESARRHGATNAMLQADFAVRLFEQEHGRSPHSLEELVPQYLPAIPLDPYSGKSLCYKLEDDGITVYSVDRDGSDNGGNFGNLRTYWSSASGFDLDLDMQTRP